MTHTLCLDNCQVFHFTVNGDYSWAPNSSYEARANICVCRYDVTKISRSNPRGEITGCWVMPRDEARKLWKSLIQDGAFRA